MSATEIDRLYNENQQIIALLITESEVSLRVTMDDVSRKALLLSSASYFEHQIHQLMLDFVAERTKTDSVILSLIKAKAIDRQYHTYFNWDASNANQFFGLFGTEFSTFMKQAVKADEGLEASIRAFLEIGSLRNQLVHQNFATFPLDKTADEIYLLYQRALKFVECLPGKFREFSKSEETKEPKVEDTDR